MLEKLKKGDTVVFKNGEEAIVEGFKDEGASFRICFNKEVTGWVGETAKYRYWDYRNTGAFVTVDSNGNDIVKVVKC